MKEVNPVGGSDGEVQGRIHNVSESQRRATLDPNHLSLLTNEIHANKLYYYYYYYLFVQTLITFPQTPLILKTFHFKKTHFMPILL